MKLKQIMKKLYDFKIEIKYFLIGVAFGFLFPLIAWGYEFYSRDSNGFKINTTEIIQQNPMIIMISTAPFFLGMFALFGGIQRSKAEKANQLLKIEIEERKKIQKKIEQIAYYDDLTGLPNRAMFSSKIDHAMLISRRFNKKIALMFLDLDGFKNINDTLGHKAGDIMLAEVAYRLRSAIRKSDMVSRIGGDEFNVLVENIENSQCASIIAEKLLKGIGEPFVIDGKECVITASIGIAISPIDGNTVEELTKRADLAMYRAKDNGKNQYALFSEKSIV